MSKMNAYVLLDRSGSMAWPNWNSTLEKVNEYVSSLKGAEGSKIFVTVATFHSEFGPRFNVIRDKVLVQDYKPLTSAEASPLGGTPLYDSIVKIIEKARDERGKFKSLLVVSDGAENSSRENGLQSVRSAIKSFKDKDYLVTFIGMDMDAHKEASSIGVHYSDTMSLTKSMFGTVGLNAASIRTSSYYGAEDEVTGVAYAAGTVRSFDDIKGARESEDNKKGEAKAA